MAKRIAIFTTRYENGKMLKRKKFICVNVRTKDCEFFTKNYKSTTVIILYAYTYHDSAWPGTSISAITLTPKLELKMVN